MDLDAVATAAHALAPPEKRDNVMEGLEEVQARLDAKNMGKADKKAGKKKTTTTTTKGGAGGGGGGFDAKDVPDSFKQGLGMPDFKVRI